MKRAVLALTLFILPAPLFAQGPLTPPAPPGPTMVTLSQVEPRTPITNLPYSITLPGSYYITTNMTGIVGSPGITILANDVTVDLRGFTLQGVPGSGPAISVSNSVRNLAIRNGVLDGWGVRGTNAYNSLFERLRESNSGGPGLVTGSNCVVSVCTVSANFTVGIGVGNNGSVKDCTVSGTSGIGIQALNNCVVADCTASGNSSDGINGGIGTVVRGCASYENGGNGITATNSCTVIGCTASGNNGATSAGILGNGSTVKDCTVSSNLFGIWVGNSCTVKDCTASTNSSSGILVTGNGSLITGNTCNGNGLGIFITGGQNRIDGNLVTQNGDGIAPTTANAGNMITRNSAPGNASANYFNYTGNADYAPTGSVSTATNPWTNF
jgi:parallel beta-helix repeat protein